MLKQELIALQFEVAFVAFVIGEVHYGHVYLVYYFSSGGLYFMLNL